tara:strand:- start:9161 stop:10087 length:927 start_codon:yes stop_codon:yes gene_type:complete
MKTLFLGYGKPTDELMASVDTLSQSLDWKNKDSFSVAFDLLDTGEVDRSAVEAQLNSVIHCDSIRWYTSEATELMFSHIQKNVDVNTKSGGFWTYIFDKITATNFFLQNPLIDEHDYVVAYQTLPASINGVWPMDLHRSTGAIITHNPRYVGGMNPRPETMGIFDVEGEIDDRYMWLFNHEFWRQLTMKGMWDPRVQLEDTAVSVDELGFLPEEVVDEVTLMTIEPVDDDEIAAQGNAKYFELADKRLQLPTICENPETPPLLETIRKSYRNWEGGKNTWIKTMVENVKGDYTVTDVRTLLPKVADIY